MADITTPHDAFFKDMMADSELAGQLIREHLPSSFTGLIADEAPELVPGSFVDDELRQHISDVLHRLKLKDGGAAYIYTLFEHKSQPDPMTPFQLLRYMEKIWSKLIRDGENLPLPTIIPLVIYHGERKWNVPTSFLEMQQELPGDMRKYQVNFAYELVDLSQMDDERMSDNPRLASFLLALKHGRNSDVEDHLLIILAGIDDFHELDFFRLMT
jgi:predicted transposase/invertase (TIGR01784 family)